MKFLLAFLLGASAVTALSHHTSNGHRAIRRHNHNHIAARSLNQVTRSRGSYEKRASAHRLKKALSKRKTPGQGDSTTAPSNIAQGTFTADQGCAVWHTVQDGEVCLGMIDKSSASFTLDKFLQFNPSLDANCDNLTTGLAYCVDTTAGSDSSSSSSTNNAVSSTSQNTPARVNAVNGDSNTEDESDDSEDCEDDDGDSSDSDDDGEDDGEDCEEDDDDSSANANISVKVPSSNKSGSNEPYPSQSEDSSSSNDYQPTPSESSSAEEPSETSGSSSSSSNGQTLKQFNGVATYYYQNGNPGNCGKYMQDSDYIVALYTPVYGNGDHCGKKVRLTNTANGNSVVATVMDSCPSCETNGNIDCSTSVFSALSDNNMGLGVLNVDWGFL